MFSPLIISSNRSQKLEAVSRAKGERTVTWLPWKLKRCHALSRVTWQGLENVSLHFQLISPAPISLQERYQGTQGARLSHGQSTVGWGLWKHLEDSLPKYTGVGCHVFLQGILPTQGSNLHLLHWQVDFFYH